MATAITIFIRFASGRFASLVNNSVTVETLSEIQTGGTDLAQVSGVSVGQAFTGDVATHAVAKVSTEGATTASFCTAYFLGPDGAIVCPIQGGGAHVEDMPQLVKSVRMTTGLTAQAKFDTAADAGTQIATLTVYASNGYCDSFFVKATNGQANSMTNAQNATIGQAMNGLAIVGAYATWSSDNSLGESLAGNEAFYIESSEGTLKAMYPPGKGTGQTPVPWQRYPVRILQNDTLSVYPDQA